MEENILLDAIERYRNGQMPEEEKTYFEELRKNNAKIDQAAAGHLFFLGELERMSQVKALKHNMNLVESKLENEGMIASRERKTKAKITYLWNRYRRTIAVAACIAGLVSISTATLVSLYSKNKEVAAITPLVDNKLTQFENKLNQIENKLNSTTGVPGKPKFEANFRATGFLADGNGFIITNAHVVNSAKNLIVENKDGEQFSAKAVYANSLTDLAILEITDTAFKKVKNLPYTFTRTATDLAEPIFTLGFPREEVVYGEGYLSAKSGYFGDTTSYQISISANPGNSGGPVLNKNGEIIGIISSKETKSDDVVFAIKSNSIYNALHELNKTQEQDLVLPETNTLKGMSRVKQIKNLEDFVYKVKGN